MGGEVITRRVYAGYAQHDPNEVGGGVTRMKRKMEMKGGRVRKEEVVTRRALQNEFWCLVGRHGLIESGGIGLG